jgi:hypothetical protein
MSEVFSDLLVAEVVKPDLGKALYKGSTVTILGQIGNLSQVIWEGRDPEFDSFSVKSIDLKPLKTPRK